MQRNPLNSCKAHREQRSVFEAELYSFADGFDFAFSLQHDLRTILKRYVAIKLYTESKSLFDMLITAGYTSEKRLMIDLISLRDAYERGEISDQAWIRFKFNPADAMNKLSNSDVLEKILEHNVIEHPVEQWVVKKTENPIGHSR